MGFPSYKWIYYRLYICIIYLHVYYIYIHMIFTHLESPGFFGMPNGGMPTITSTSTNQASFRSVVWLQLLEWLEDLLHSWRFEDLRNQFEGILSCKKNMSLYYYTLPSADDPSCSHTPVRTNHTQEFPSLKSHCPKVLPVPGGDWIKHDG